MSGFIIPVLLPFLFVSLSFARSPHPDATITGKVTDAAQKPLQGVSVTVKGTATVTVTNEQGAFTISAGADATLIFSFVGYKDQQEEVRGRTDITIVMQQSSGQLNEVVVTALGIRKERRSLGYSVTEVAGSSLTQARETNVANNLEGKVAGVNVSGVATGPGSSANVVIRGVSSIAGSSQPLYVIDGIPMTNTTYGSTDNDGYGGVDQGDGIGNINPDDIESISILKGAAASALYGYRGAKGVILITTKSGRKGNGLGVDVNSNMVVERVVDNTHWQTTYGQGYNGLKPASAADAIGSNLNSWGAKLDGQPTIQSDGVKRPYAAVGSNLNRFYQPGITATNTVAFSKGLGSDGSLRFSASDVDQNSMIPNAGLYRQTFELSAQYQLSKRLSLELKANYITQFVKNRPSVSDAPGNLNYATSFLPPNLNIKILSPGYTANGYEDRFLNDEYTTNPYFVANKFINNSTRNRFIGLANLKYTFDNGLYMQLRTGEDYFNDHNINVTPTGTAYQIFGGMTDGTYKSTELNVDGIIGKTIKFSKDFSVDALAGANYRKVDVQTLDVFGSDFAIPFLYNVGNLKSAIPYPGHPVIVNASVYATLDMSFKNLLYLNVTGRNDWYSTLAPGKVNYLYPSINGSFVFSELWKPKAMDFGKLRVGYADVGGEADDPYQTFLTYDIANGVLTYPDGTVFPLGNIVNGDIPNSKLRPSSVKETEIGTELSFFQSRLKFDIAAYQKRITNSIIAATISETSGYPGAYLNLGNLRNNGIEFLVTGTPVKATRFNWNISVNGAYNNNKVLALSSDQDNYLLSNSRVGEDDGQSLAYITQIVGKQASQIVALDPERDEKGNIIIDSATGAPSLDGAAYKPFGSGISPWAGGVSNEFSFKGFNLSFLVDGKFGGKIFSGTNYFAFQNGLSKETLTGREQKYGTDSISPQTYYTYLSNVSSHFIYDASFIKLRQVIIGYTFPAKAFHNKIQGITLSFVARNVATLMKHTPNIDPESNYTNYAGQGLELAGVPASRTYGLNLNIRL